MKKLILILAIALIASPVFAVNITLEKVGNVINVKYDTNGSTPATRMRAVALDLTMTGGTFDSISGFKTGESTSASPGYGIYPAKIVINSAGVVTDSGNPLADSGDPGAGTGFGTGHIVLEFGSLYFNDSNAPAASGTLCSLNITKGTATQIVMTDEDTYRGGLVFVDGTLGAVSVTLPLPPDGTAPPKAVIGAPADAGTGISRTLDLTWTAGAGGTPATARDVYFGTATSPVTKVIADGTVLTYDTGTMVQGKTYYWRVDEKNTFGTTTGDVWSFTVEECLKTTATGYTDWVSWGKPSCWCYQRHCRGDFNGAKQGVITVTSVDLDGLVAAYGKNKTLLSQVANGICADFNHTKSGVIHVNSTDLGLLTTYYGKNLTLTPVCDVAQVNFWMN